MVVACHQKLYVEVNDVAAFVAKGLVKHLDADARIQSQQKHQGAQGHGVLHHGQGFAETLGERVDRQGDRDHVVGQQRDVAVKFVRVKDDHSSGAHFGRMAFHGVLIQRDNRVQRVPMGAHLLLTDAHAQPDMSAADDGLVAVVSVDPLALPGRRQGQGIPGRGDTVPRGPADTDDQFGLVPHGYTPTEKGQEETANPGASGWRSARGPVEKATPVTSSVPRRLFGSRRGRRSRTGRGATAARYGIPP